ncbi:endonuclease domain-containing protein [Candidatus Dojkabacteria bacterium]|jgi:very-short-patch-repair endonuclease|nr:endonuclease domain-containing protein [Candidatus Dojkabacteria bacterium]
MAKRINLTVDEINLIIKLYKDKEMGAPKLSKKFNISVSSIYKILKRNNIASHTQGSILKNKTYHKDLYPNYGWRSRKGKTWEEIHKNSDLKTRRIKASKLMIYSNPMSKLRTNAGTFKKGHKAFINNKGITHKEYFGEEKAAEIAIKIKKARAKQVTPKVDTKIEVKIRDYLEILGLEYYQHKYLNINHGYQCDFFIPTMNLVIECDGTYWHKYPIGNELDHIRTKELIEKGFKVLRLWESEIKVMEVNDLKERIYGKKETI